MYTYTLKATANARYFLESNGQIFSKFWVIVNQHIYDKLRKNHYICRKTMGNYGG